MHEAKPSSTREQMTSDSFTVDQPIREEETDLSLLEDSLAKTPWERMQANDDALRFADSLREAMKNRNARLERINAQVG
jgi:hypothetical protein